MLILLSNLALASALAQNPFDMQFPIPELGNCGSMQECKIYCDDPGHQNACMQWAKPEPKAGPGGCASREECDNFCKRKENMNICLDFAVKDGFMTQAEADKLKKRQPKEPEHHEPKIDEEKAMQIVLEHGGPGGCANFEECDKFCSTPGNEETCMNFAIKHGLFKPGEAERIKKMMSIQGPGGCKGIECKDYCDKPGHELECMEFAHKQGFMDEEEYKEAKKFMDATGGTGIGPGGCRNEECEIYCDNPAHQDECFEFFKKHDMIDPEELEMIENMKKREMEMERKRQEEGLRHEAEEQKRMWQEMENIQKHSEDENLREFYQKFPMDTEWDEAAERRKEEYWQKVEETRGQDEKRARREAEEFEKHMQEKQMREMQEQQELQNLEPKLEPEPTIKPAPLGALLYPFLQLLR